MSGASLCSLLEELGYDGWQDLDADSFEWPYQYDETGPLLDWLCANLRPSNALTAEEAVLYNALKAEGKLLEGEELDSAYESISAFGARKSSEEDVLGAEETITEIKESTVVCKGEAAMVQKHIRQAQANLDALSAQTTTLMQGRRLRSQVASSRNRQLQIAEEQLASCNLEINTVLEKLCDCIQQIAHYQSGEEEGTYLNFMDMSPFTQQEAICTTELGKWFTKQFDMGPSEVASEEGKLKSSYSSLEDLTQSLSSVEQTYNDRVSELQRLRSIFGVSERQWVEAQVDNAKHQAMLATAKLQISTDQTDFHADLYSLRQKYADLVNESQLLVQQEEKLLSEVVPSLCWELAQLQDTYILQGDYDIKVKQQETYVAQQKKFIGHLVNQLARHTFLKITCDLERKEMNSVYELLKVFETEVDAFTQATLARIERCSAIILSSAEAKELGAMHVDDRDTLLHRVRDILNSQSHEQGASPMYVSAPGLAQQINNLHTQLQSAQLEVGTTLVEDKAKCLNELYDLIRKMQQLLFASSATAQPILSPWPLMKELMEMEKVNSQLSAAIEEVTRVHREKAEIVKHHPREIGRERQVFVDFFCNPDRLRSQVRDLAARVKAMQG